MGAAARTAAIIQARMGSSRLPGKSMTDVAGAPVLAHVIRRTQQAASLDGVFVATSVDAGDDPIAALCEDMNVGVFRGSEHDVLGRYLGAALRFDVEVVVRITGDNPLVGPDVIDYVVAEHRSQGADLTTNYSSKSFPNGTVLTVITRPVLELLDRTSRDPRVREHVIADLDAVRRHFQVHVVTAPPAWRRYDIRYCIDYEEDLLLVRSVAEHFAETGEEPSTEEIIAYLDTNEAVRNLNRHYAEQGY